MLWRFYCLGCPVGNPLAQVNSDHLKPLHRKALALLEQFDDQRVYWVPRERNTDADKLVREALSER